MSRVFHRIFQNLIKPVLVMLMTVCMLLQTVGTGTAGSVSVSPTTVVLGDPVNPVVGTWSGFAGTNVNVGVYYGSVSNPTLLCYANTLAPTSGTQSLYTNGACGTGWTARSDYMVGIELKISPFTKQYSNNFYVVNLSIPSGVNASYQSSNSWNYISWGTASGTLFVG